MAWEGLGCVQPGLRCSLSCALLRRLPQPWAGRWIWRLVRGPRWQQLRGCRRFQTVNVLSQNSRGPSILGMEMWESGASSGSNRTFGCE